MKDAYFYINLFKNCLQRSKINKQEAGGRCYKTFWMKTRFPQIKKLKKVCCNVWTYLHENVKKYYFEAKLYTKTI